MALNASNASNITNVTEPVNSPGLLDGPINQVNNFFNAISKWFLSQPGIEQMLSFSIDYLHHMPDKIIGLLYGRGDVAALVLFMILSYIIIVVLNKLTTYLIKVVKNLMILTIIGAAYYSIVMTFIRGLGDNPDPLFVLLGALGIGVGFLAVLIAFYFVLFHTHKSVKAKKGELEEEEPTEEKPPAPDIKKSFSFSGLKEGMTEGRHTLTTMLTYMLIAEFGVFSSVTISAPSVPVGIGLLVAFFAGVTLYVFRTAHHPIESLKLLFIASVAGFIMSIVLGILWVPELTLGVVLSMDYFVQPTLVAFLTGIALSLFMAGKELEKS